MVTAFSQAEPGQHFIEIKGSALRRLLKNTTKTYWLVEDNGIEEAKALQISESYYYPGGEYVIIAGGYTTGHESYRPIRVLVRNAEWCRWNAKRKALAEVGCAPCGCMYDEDEDGRQYIAEGSSSCEEHEV